MKKYQIVEAIRAANPTANVFALWVAYDTDKANAHTAIRWNYFQQCCRAFDREHPRPASGAE